MPHCESFSFKSGFRKLLSKGNFQMCRSRYNWLMKYSFKTFTSSYAHDLITVTTFTLTIYHSLSLSLQT